MDRPAAAAITVHDAEVPSPSTLHSLTRPITPPPSTRQNPSPVEVGNVSDGHPQQVDLPAPDRSLPTLAAVEAGRAQVRDHLDYFSTQLSDAVRPQHISPSTPRLSLARYCELYQRNQHPHGHHFVVHQHDHPVAGVHYDLRLQISRSSTISFAIMYGLPGNPNSRRPMRQATETRVHNMWNHLIESASHSTGSLLIWDTGDYEVLPYIMPEVDSDSASSSGGSGHSASFRYRSKEIQPKEENEKLVEAFKNRKIRLRLHGARLPSFYTLSLRLPSFTDHGGPPSRHTRKRRRRQEPPVQSNDANVTSPSTSEDEQVYSQPQSDPPEEESEQATAMAREIAEAEDAQTRITNAYPGATNSIGSVHQRKWFLSLDRESSGFQRMPSKDGSISWIPKAADNEYPAATSNSAQGFEPFFVMGREVERSVVTGRRASDIMADEGVSGYVGRRGWRPVVD